MKTFSTSEVISVGGYKKEYIEEAIKKLIKPNLNDCKPAAFDKQYILSPPLVPHYIQLEVDDDLLDPRRPKSAKQVAFHCALAHSRKLQCIWILPVTYQIDIGGEYPYNLKQRLHRLYGSLSIAIEAVEGKARMYDFVANKRQLYIYREKVAQKQKRPKRVN